MRIADLMRNPEIRIPQFGGGQRWIRTTEVERQRIYSPPHLAALESARIDFGLRISDYGFRISDCALPLNPQSAIRNLAIRNLAIRNQY